MEISLSKTELDAFKEMGITNIETYLKSIASNHIKQQLDTQLLAKTLEEKQALLDS